VEAKYLSCAETASLLRKALAREFPGTKFSVRSSVYSMGASIRVRWTDGPSHSRVKAVTEQFEGADFDGMIDLKSYNDHWLSLDGKAHLARVEGTRGSGGYQESGSWSGMPGEIKVHFEADSVSCQRALSRAFLERLAQVVVRERGVKAPQIVQDSRGHWYAKEDYDTIEGGRSNADWLHILSQDLDA
jgi:hypothetical protein